MRKLNGWQRIGVILSILWVFGAGYLEREEQVDIALRVQFYKYDLCMSSAARDKGCDLSHDIGFKGYGALNPAGIGKIAKASLMPPLFCWLFAWLAIVVYRWVRVGFQGIK